MHKNRKRFQALVPWLLCRERVSQPARRSLKYPQRLRILWSPKYRQGLRILRSPKYPQRLHIL